MANSEKAEARKVKILETAAKVFSEKGFQEATIAEIARSSRTSEATIYDYFTTKENLLFSIPYAYMNQMTAVMAYHLPFIRGSANKIFAILNNQLLFYSEHPEFTAVLMLILKHNPRFIDTESHKVIRMSLRFFDSIITEGIESGEFRADIDPYFLRCTFIGTLEHIIINWLMVGNPKDLSEASDHLYDICIRLLKKDDRENKCPFIAKG